MANPDIVLSQTAPIYPNAEQSGFGRYDRKQQQSLLNIYGDGVLQGAIEVEDVDYTGTRSNVFTPSANEIITVSLIDGFNSGATQIDTQLDFDTESNSVTHSDAYSWPTGDISGGTLPSGWMYTQGGGSSSLQETVEATITNNTGVAVALNNASFSITIDVTALPAGGTTQPACFINQEDTFLISNFTTITSIGSYTVADTTSTSEIILQDGQSINMFIFESTDAQQGFTYTITDFQLNVGASTATQYNLDVDLSDAVFIGDVSGSFTNNIDATAGVTEIATATTSMFPTITSGSVYNSLTPDTGTDFTLLGRDQVGDIGSLAWDLRDTAADNSTTVTYASWDDWDNNFLAIREGLGTLPALAQLAAVEANFSNMTISLTDRTDSSITATLALDMISIIDVVEIYFSITSVISQTGVPAQDTNWDFILTADVNSKAIDLDTNQIIDVGQMITITPNSGFKAVGEVIASDGIAASGQASTYTVTDPYGTELTSFTSSVSSNTETDVAEVVSMIVGAINNNTETPIDFTASSTGTAITITAASGGVIPSVWIVSVNNHGQVTDAGNVVFNTATRTTVGIDAAVSVIGGGLTSALQVSGPSLTKAQIVDGLNNAVADGARVYNDPDADVAIISDDFAEEIELDMIVSGTTDGTLDFSTSVKYWGVASGDAIYPDIDVIPFGRYDRKQQQSLFSIDGSGSLVAGTEIQSALYSGIRSNVFTPASSTIVTLNIITDIDTGVTQNNTQLLFATESDPVTHEVDDLYSWPTGDISGGSLPAGWSYTPGSGSGDSSSGTAGFITNNTGSILGVINLTASITIDVTALPAGGSTTPTFNLEFENGANIVVGLFDEITSVGSYTLGPLSSTSRFYIQDAESLRLLISESAESERGFTYTITNLEVNTGDSLSTAYNLDLDTTNAVFNGDVVSSFGNDLTAAQAVQQMANDVIATFPSITAGEVYDSTIIETVASIAEYITRDTMGELEEFSWDVRDSASDNSTSIDYAVWDDWTGNYFVFGVSGAAIDSIIFKLLLIGLFGEYDNTTLTVTDNSDPSITATFGFDMTSGTGSGRFVQLTTLISQSGVPSTQDVIWDFEVSSGESSRAIDLNTNQPAAIDQMLVLTQNSGRNTAGDVSASDGDQASGQASTYTVTDPFGMEVTSFTSFVSSNTETDAAFVISTIVNAINNNTEMPIDFIASSDGSSITISAQTTGAVPTTWTLFVNHHGQITDAGDINIGAAIPTSTGTDLSVTFSGGGLSSDLVLNDTSLTKSEILTQLIDNLPSGVTMYPNPDVDIALISNDSSDYPAFDADVEGDINSTLTLTTTTKYWGHT